jgi:hypothetical protein
MISAAAGDGGGSRMSCLAAAGVPVTIDGVTLPGVLRRVAASAIGSARSRAPATSLGGFLDEWLINSPTADEDPVTSRAGRRPHGRGTHRLGAAACRSQPGLGSERRARCSCRFPGGGHGADKLDITVELQSALLKFAANKLAGFGFGQLGLDKLLGGTEAQFQEFQTQLSQISQQLGDLGLPSLQDSSGSEERHSPGASEWRSET